MRSLVQATAPLRISPLLGALSFSSGGMPSDMFDGVVVARRPPDGARREFAAGGLRPVAVRVGDKGELLARCLRTFSSSRRCMGTRWESSWMRSLMLSRRRRSTMLCDSRLRRRLASTVFICGASSGFVGFEGKELNLLDLRISLMCGCWWMGLPGEERGESIPDMLLGVLSY